MKMGASSPGSTRSADVWKWLETPAPLVAAAILYLFQALAYYRTERPGMALALAAYALANVGLIWAWYQGPTGN